MEILNIAIERGLVSLALFCQHQGIPLDSTLQKLVSDYVLSEETVQDLTTCFWEAVRETKAAGQVARYEKLMQRRNMGKAAVCAMDLCLAVLKYPKLKNMLHALGVEQITLELAFKVENLLTNDGEDMDYGAAETAFAQIEPLLCSTVSLAPFYRYPLCADERLMGFLSGSDTIDKRLAGVATHFFYREPLPPLLINESMVPKIAAALMPRADETLNILQMEGAVGCGRRTLLCHGAAAAGLNLLLLNDEVLLSNEPRAVRDILWGARREMLFYEMGIVLYGIEQSSQQEQK
ncbi:MAG: hypothetical protein RRY40_02770, partial [Oscillospiraceae bacterium]